MTISLIDAIEKRLRQQAILGWKPGARRQIIVAAGHATLLMGWIRTIDETSTPQPVIEGDDTRIRDHVISVDTRDLPSGIEALAWDGLPDTTDRIETPSDDEIIRAAALLGCSHVDRGVADDCAIYYLRVRNDRRRTQITARRTQP